MWWGSIFLCTINSNNVPKDLSDFPAISELFGGFKLWPQITLTKWVHVSPWKGVSYLGYWLLAGSRMDCYSLDLRHTYSRKAGPREARWESRSLFILPGGTQNRASVIQSLSHLWLSAIPWTAARQPSLSFIVCWSLLKLMSLELVMPSNCLILWHPLLLLASIFPSIRVFSNELALHIRWAKVLELQLQHQFFQRIFRVDFL